MTLGGVVRFAVVGMDHPHIYDQVRHALRGGGRLVGFYEPDDGRAKQFVEEFGGVTRARTDEELLDREDIDLIVTSTIPSERAPLGVRAMRNGKDFMTDKPGFTTLSQLAEVRAVQAETGRIYSICFSEHFSVPSVVAAGAIVASGRIGQVIQTLGLGPHRANLGKRPRWFFDRTRYGGILNDIGSHQVEQFLYFTGSRQASIVSAVVANFHHPDEPGLEDFGELSLQGDGGLGYFRVDWFTPGGIEPFGDGRLFILGTDGYIEIRKYVDPGGRDGGDHLIVVDHSEAEYIDESAIELPYGPQLMSDVLHRTETACPQWRTFLASELALRASAQAVRLGALGPLTGVVGSTDPFETTART